METTDGARGAGRFARYAWLVLAYNLLVILWGAVVRATGSGAGCGEHWPLCQGEVIPHAQQIATAIEFAHRATSGIDLILVACLIGGAFRRYRRGHPVRRYAAATGFFTVTEGLVGAALVLFGEVGKTATLGRMAILSVHLTNTFLLLASLALTAWAASQQARGGGKQVCEPPRKLPPKLLAAYLAGLAGMLGIAISGTIASLADTLFPAHSLAEALRWDFSAGANLIVHLRVLHPAIAIALGAWLLGLGAHALHRDLPAGAKRLARLLIGLLVLQFCFGIFNIALLAPLWMQVLHLLTADLLWITVVLLSSEVLGWGDVRLPARGPCLAPVAEAAGR